MKSFKKWEHSVLSSNNTRKTGKQVSPGFADWQPEVEECLFFLFVCLFLRLLTPSHLYDRSPSQGKEKSFSFYTMLRSYLIPSTQRDSKFFGIVSHAPVIRINMFIFKSVPCG